MRGKIEKFDTNNVLEISYQSECVGTGKIECSYSPKTNRWVGTWQDKEKRGDIILETKEGELVGYINNDPDTSVRVTKS